MPGPCFSEEELHAFHLGKLSLDRLDAVADHLETCAACEAVMRRWEGSHDPILTPLRKAFGSSAGLAPVQDTDAEVWPELQGYPVSSVLGRGGMGVVYRAQQARLNRPVALKQLSCRTPREAARARAEAELLARLQHPHIVQIHEVIEHNGRVYLALELVEGGSLAAKLSGKPQPPRQAAALVELLARAIHYAHEKGIIHRDLKPANVLLTSDGTPKITDFGIARLLAADDGQTRDGDIIGTPSYMAPEQAAARAGTFGPATDVYSLGVLLYELLTGRVPLQGPGTLETLLLVRSEEPVPPRRLQPHIDRSLETICLKCLQKEPGKRYASALDLADDLRRFLAHEPILARPTPPWERLMKWARRQPVVAALSATLIVVAALGLGLVSWQWRRAEDRAAAAILARQDAQQKEAQEKAARQQMERVTARADLNEGSRLCEEGELSRGLLWMARALELADHCGDDDLTRSARYNLAAWQAGQSRLRARFFHAGWAWAVAFSRDGRSAVTGGTDELANLWDVVSGERLGQPLRHPAPVWAAAFSPDGKTVLTGCGDDDHGKPCEARLWDVATGRLLDSWPHPHDVGVVAFSPDGHGCVTVCAGQVTLRRSGAGSPVRSLLPHPLPKQRTDRVQPRLTAAYSPDGKLLVTAGEDGSARLWDMATAKGHGRPMQVGEPIQAVAFSPDGRTLLTGGFRGNVSFWDVSTGRRRHSLELGQRVKAVAFSPDGRLVATGTTFEQSDRARPTQRFEEGEAQLWNAATGRPVGPPLRHPAQVWSLGFTPGGRMLVTGARDGRVRVFLVATGQQIGESLPGDGTVANLVISRDGALVLSSGAGGGNAASARLVELPAEDRLPRWLLHEDSVLSLCFSPDGHTLASGGDDRIVRFWDVARGQHGASSLPHEEPVGQVVFNPDGRSLITVTEGPHQWQGQVRLRGSVLLWDLQSHQVRSAVHNIARVFSVAFDRPGRMLLLGDEAGNLHVWEAATGKPLAPPLYQGAQVYTLSFSPDESTFLVGVSGKLLVHDVQTRRLVQTWQTLGGEPHIFPYPEGKEALLVASGLAHILDVATGRLMGAPPYHPEGGISRAAVDPRGRAILIVDSDRTARLWDLHTGKKLGPMPASVGALCTAISPDGRHLAVGRQDGVIALWQMPQLIEGTPERLRLWVEVLTGLELDADETIRSLSPDEQQHRRRRLEELGGPPRVSKPQT